MKSKGPNLRRPAGYSSLKDTEVSLDVHFHTSPNKAGDLIRQGDELSLSHSKKTLLISDSFQFFSPAQLEDDDNQEFIKYLEEEEVPYSADQPLEYYNEREFAAFKSPKSRENYMQFTSDLHSRFPEKTRGLCGVDPRWEDFKEITNFCLNLKGMIGLKLHGLVFGESDDSLDSIANLLSSEVGKKIKIILWHPSTAYNAEYGDTEEDKRISEHKVKRILEIVKNNAKVTFIFAHMFNADRWSLQEFTKQINNSGYTYPNLFADLSLFFTDTGTAEDSQVYNLSQQNALDFRDFSIERIVYGTDYIASHNSVINRNYVSIKNSDFLSEEEKNKILIENGQKIIDLVF
jgi:predicted TIM-barrel fold metal-dependent hydrolase